MEVHSFFCDVCNQEFAESELMTLDLPVRETGDGEAEYYRDDSLRRPSVHMERMDICDGCLINATVMQKVDTGKAVFINDLKPCPDDARVGITKHASETTTRHGRVVKKKGGE